MAEKIDVTTMEFLNYLDGKCEGKYEEKRKAMIAATEKANAAKKAKTAEKRKDVDEPIRTAILDIVGADNIVSADLAEKVRAYDGLGEIKTAKVVAVANALRDEGVLVAERVVVAKGARNAYRKA